MKEQPDIGMLVIFLLLIYTCVYLGKLNIDLKTVGGNCVVGDVWQ